MCGDFYLPDLTVITQKVGMDIWGESVRAIAWLDPEKEFSRGKVAQEILLEILKHVDKPFTLPLDYMCGGRQCQLCKGKHDKRKRSSSPFSKHLYMIVPTLRYAYVASPLVGHYIEAHNYKPPQSFIDAVLSAPEPNSSEFTVRLNKLVAQNLAYVRNWS